MIDVRKVSRRSFVKTTGVAGSGLVLGVRIAQAGEPWLTPWMGRVDGGADADATFQPNVYVGIEVDGTIRLTVHRTEMGQGIRTACAMLIAEELGVGLDSVEIAQAQADGKYGNQSTSGSRSIRSNWEPLRTAGAAAREMLVATAAARWGVPAADCHTSGGSVRHAGSNQQLDYGELAAEAATLPIPENPVLKDPADFRLVGTAQPLVDVADMVRGTATYAWDVTLPDMLFAGLERSPMVGGRIARYDRSAALAVTDVIDVVELEPNGSGLTNASIAVVAGNTWAAFQGRRALGATWQAGAIPEESSPAYAARLEEIGSAPANVVRAEGDFDAAAEAADHVLEARYAGPYLAHASMAPPACAAYVEGDRCEVWAPTQAPQWTRREIAGQLGLEEVDVTVNVTLLGGAFGRKSKPDFAVEAAMLSQKLGRPVKVAWTREDDIRHGFYRAQNFQLLKAAIDSYGDATGWLQRSVFPGIGWNFDPDDASPSDGEFGQGLSNLPYRIPNLRLEGSGEMSAVRIGWMRSVCNTFHSFAVNGFIDEIAHDTGRDTVALHLALLGEPRVLEFTEDDRRIPWKFDTGRLTGVIEAAADMAGWGRRLPGRQGLGFAAQYSFLSYVAMAAHVSVDAAGELTVHRVDCAVDCGPVVNPDTIEAQMHGAVAMALSYTLYGKITLDDGVVQQGNFHDYPVLRMHEMPDVNVRIIQSDVPPTGIGEPGVPPTAPAVCNAIFAATGVRIRDLPLAGQSLG